MPFRETSKVEERIALFREFDCGLFSVSALCRKHGISRQTFYDWKARRDAGEAEWFLDRSHAVETCPHATEAWMANAVTACRRKHPEFGPKKIKAVLERERPDVTWPAASTIGDILKRAGLVEARERRRKAQPTGVIAAADLQPNDEWAIDFKGWFRTRDGTRCDPLTITDTAVRFLIEVRIMDQTYADVRCALERVFCAYGLPSAIRSDNGSPFGSSGAGGLSRLSVWLLKLGIEPHYIRPAKPQENGRHERMHRTLKDATARVPSPTIVEQQQRFDDFRRHFNEERPHEALAQATPASLWMPSSRVFPERIAEPWYDANHEVRRVRHDGCIKWRGDQVFIGEALAGEPVGIADIEAGGHVVRFCGRDLGALGVDGHFLRFAPPRARLRSTAEAPIDTGTSRE